MPRTKDRDAEAVDVPKEGPACARCRFFSRTSTGATSIRGDCVKPIAVPGDITNAIAKYIAALTNIEGAGGKGCGCFEAGMLEDVKVNLKVTPFKKPRVYRRKS